jgi:hypothetical protein
MRRTDHWTDVKKFLGSAILSLLAALAMFASVSASMAQDAPQTLFTNVHVFDGVSEDRIQNANVLVEGNSLEDLDLVADPDTNFDLIMKDGKIYKNAL